MDGELRRRALERAVEIAGGTAALRGRLGVDDHQLALWLRGQARIPLHVFDAAVDLILADDIARAAQDRRERPREVAQPVNSA
jgi:hypothetical protein